MTSPAQAAGDPTAALSPWIRGRVLHARVVVGGDGTAHLAPSGGSGALGHAAFDTVVFGEPLEPPLLVPVLPAVRDALRPGGRLVVTLALDDEARTGRDSPGAVVGELTAHFGLEMVEPVGDAIALVAVAGASGIAAPRRWADWAMRTTARVRRLERLLAEGRERARDLATRSAAQAAELADVKSELAQDRERHRGIERLFSARDDRATALSMEVARLEEELRLADAAHRAVVGRLEEEVLSEGRRSEARGKALQEHADQLAAEVKVQVEELDRLHARVEEYEQHLRDALIRLDDERAAGREREEKNAALEKDAQALMARLEGADGEIAHLRSRLGALENELSERWQDEASTRQELADWRERAAEAYTEANETKQLLEASETEGARAQLERAWAVGELARAHGALARRNEHIEAMRNTRLRVLARAVLRTARRHRFAAGAALFLVSGVALAACVLAVAASNVALAVVSGTLGVLIPAAALAFALAVRGKRSRDGLLDQAGRSYVGHMPAAVAAPARQVVQDDVPEGWRPRSARERDVSELRLAAIVDDITRACLEPDCDLVSFGASGWEEILGEREPDLLFVESAWRGNAGAWQYRVGSYPHRDYAGLRELRALTAWCRERGIPTAFWNKEDPYHHDRFIEAAALFDAVFTTDANSLSGYEALARPAGAAVLPFAAQPRLHNPVVATGGRAQNVAFAGTYYLDRHKERAKLLDMLLDAALPFGLVIYDRMAGSDSDAYGFPERFKDRIVGSLPYERLVDAYKRHAVFLNVNTIRDSPSMCARRVFELAGCDAPIVSTPSAALSELLHGLVPQVETADQARATLERLLGDEAHRRAAAVGARREVLRHHTYRERLQSVARQLGIPVKDADRADVAVLVVLDGGGDQGGLARLVEQLGAQDQRVSEMLIGVAGRGEIAIETVAAALGGARVRIVDQDGATEREERYRELAALATAHAVAPMAPRHAYGPHHVSDLWNASRFSRAEIVGRPLDRALENRFVSAVHPHAALVDRDLVSRRGWVDDEPAAASAMEGLCREGVRCFGADAEDFVPAPA